MELVLLYRAGESGMKREEVVAIARRHNIRIGQLKKAELVKAIQAAEGNETCFASGRAAECGQHSCLWREDCS